MSGLDWLTARRIPRALAAALVVALLTGGMSWVVYSLSDEVTAMVERLPDAARRLRQHVSDGSTKNPTALQNVQEAARELEKAAATAAGEKVPVRAVVVPAPAFQLTKGTPKRYVSKGDSGQDVARAFCADCGSPLFSEPPGGAIMVVKAASLDDPSWLKVGGALYAKSAQPWAHIDPNKLRFERMPPGAPGVQ